MKSIFLVLSLLFTLQANAEFVPQITSLVCTSHEVDPKYPTVKLAAEGKELVRTDANGINEGNRGIVTANEVAADGSIKVSGIVSRKDLPCRGTCPQTTFELTLNSNTGDAALTRITWKDGVIVGEQISPLTCKEQ